MLLSVYLPLLFVGVVSVVYARNRLAADTEALFAERVNQAVSAVDGKLSEMKSVFATVNIQSWMFDILRAQDVVTESFEYIDNYRDMTWFLFSLKEGLGIDSVGLYFRRPNAFVDGVSFHQLEALERALGPVVTRVGSRVAIWLGPSDDHDTISFVGPMLQKGAEFVFEGRVWIQVDALFFRSALANISSTIPFAASILDSDGNEVIGYSSASQETSSELQKSVRHSETDIQIGKTLSTNRWRLEAGVPRSYLTSQTLYELRTLLVALLLVTLAVAPALMFLSGSLSRRIATIREAMETREVTSTGLLTRIAHSTPAGGDEIDGLVRSYNRMAHRIETLVDTVYRAELEASHHHLSALQSQINPHFLYNALDAIRCNVSLNERALAEEIIRSLSRLLRIALSGGREMISIARELELVSLYLKLNSAVYGARFAFAIDDAPWAGEYAIPKFVLQPLVENAISHGLDAVQTGGVVRVLALCDDRRIEIVVEDNGAGFSQSRLAEVTAALASHRGAGTSIGLPNVEQRIKLSFGNEYGLRISNGTEGGARVSVLIPKIAMKEQGE